MSFGRKPNQPTSGRSAPVIGNVNSRSVSMASVSSAEAERERGGAGPDNGNGNVDPAEVRALTGDVKAWLPDGDSQILRSLVFGPSGFWTMAPLRCKV